MLGGRISAHDEEEVEDELRALEDEMNPVQIPSAPQNDLKQQERKKQVEEGVLPRREAMLA